MTYKKDEVLGELVHQELVKRGLETPIFNLSSDNDEKIKNITHHFNEIMKTLGLDMHDHSLANTPKRFAKAYVNELFKGLDYTQFPQCAQFQNKKNNRWFIYFFK
jgi:GTP cyclohydrolase IA